jgi:hypothetical protein
MPVSKIRLKNPETPLQFPLRGGLLTAVKKCLASRGRLVRAQRFAVAGTVGGCK